MRPKREKWDTEMLIRRPERALLRERGFAGVLFDEDALDRRWAARRIGRQFGLEAGAREELALYAERSPEHLAALLSVSAMANHSGALLLLVRGSK